MFLFLSSTFLWAQRPTEGGLFSYASDDQMAFYDLEFVRVHFSTSGSNLVLEDDEDDNGVPDYVENIAETTLEAWFFYENMGFRSPIREGMLYSEFDDLGGSDSFDIYLVDFNGSADGHLGLDSCGDGFCSGYLVIENDFSGYGYSSIDIATRVLVSHELFHAVQAAYRISFSPWISEGLATWAEHLFDHTLMDYYHQCGGYLAEPTRSINSTPAGAISSFSYGTALFFDFVAIHLGMEFWITVLEELSEEAYHSNDDLDEMEVIIPLAESWLTENNTGFVDFIDLWNTFGIWNIATGWRSGLVEGIGEGAFESYGYADRLDEVAYEKMSEETNKLEDTHRFYPLSASYFWFQHDGGVLPFYTSTFRNDTPLHFALVSVSSEQDGLFGDVENIIDIWESQSYEFRQWDLPNGDYWLIGLVGGLADESQKTTFCIGSLCNQDDFIQLENESEDIINEGEKEQEGKLGCSFVPPSKNSFWIVLLAFYARRKRI